MATFVLVHGGGDVGWYWHLVEDELRQRGHDVVAPDLPCDDDTADLRDYADAVVDAIGDRRDLIVVGHSYGGFTAPLVADRLAAVMLVLVAGMIPAPGENRRTDGTTLAMGSPLHVGVRGCCQLHYVALAEHSRLPLDSGSMCE